MKRKKTLVPDGDDDAVYLTPRVEIVDVLHAGTGGLSAGPGHGVGPGIVIRRHLSGPRLVTPPRAAARSHHGAAEVTVDADQA